MPPPIYILLHRDSLSTTTVLSVFADLQDANAQCLQYAKEAGVNINKDEQKPSDTDKTEQPTTTSPSSSNPKSPLLLRWESAEGSSCWVECHEVVPRKVLQPPLESDMGLRPGRSGEAGVTRKGSRLYDEDEDDHINDEGDEGHYD